MGHPKLRVPGEPTEQRTREPGQTVMLTKSLSERAADALEAVRARQVSGFARARHRMPGPVDMPSHGQPAAMFELAVPVEPRVHLGRWLVESRGWPAEFAARNVDLFAAAVKRAFIEERGEEPVWDGGWVYLVSDLPLVERVYESQAGALAEQIAFEGLAR